MKKNILLSLLFIVNSFTSHINCCDLFEIFNSLFQNHEILNILERSKLIQEIDSELYEIYDVVCQEMGIKDEVELRVFNCPSFAPCFYTGPLFSTFCISQDLVTSSDIPNFIGTIVKPLELHRQAYKYPGSYHGDDVKLMIKGSEAPAERFFDCYTQAAAAGFFDHYKCLSISKKIV